MQRKRKEKLTRNRHIHTYTYYIMFIFLSQYHNHKGVQSTTTTNAFELQWETYSCYQQNIGPIANIS
jgi:hypothetical protein